MNMADDDTEKRPLTPREQTMQQICVRRDRINDLEGRGVENAEDGVLANEKFREAYSDIYEKPELRSLAQAIDQHMVTVEGDGRPAWERYQDIGERIRLGESKQFQARAVETGGRVDPKYHGSYFDVRRSEDVANYVEQRKRARGER
jgi:hypothetical protein